MGGIIILRSDDRTDCSQPTFAMCRFSTFGEGGFCYPNVARRWHEVRVQPFYYEAMFAPRRMEYAHPSVMRQPRSSWCLRNDDWSECHLQPSFEMCLFSTFGAGGSAIPRTIRSSMAGPETV